MKRSTVTSLRVASQRNRALVPSVESMMTKQDTSIYSQVVWSVYVSVQSTPTISSLLFRFSFFSPFVNILFFLLLLFYCMHWKYHVVFTILQSSGVVKLVIIDASADFGLNPKTSDGDCIIYVNSIRHRGSSRTLQ